MLINFWIGVASKVWHKEKAYMDSLTILMCTVYAYEKDIIKKVKSQRKTEKYLKYI